MKVTNNTRETRHFLKKDFKVKDGVPETVSIKAGETCDLDIDPDNVRVKAELFAGSITAPGKAADKAAESIAAPAATAGRRA